MRTARTAPFLILASAAVLFAGGCSSNDSGTGDNGGQVTDTPISGVEQLRGSPAGHGCTDQSGARGHYVRDVSSNMWICSIDENAPRVNATLPPGQHDDDPGGHPCQDQSGMHGKLIWADDMWVCQIS